MRSGFVRLLLASPWRKLTEEHRSVQLDRRSRICPCLTAMIAAGRPGAARSGNAYLWFAGGIPID